MWINGISIPTTSDILTYLIWKDYSCSQWKAIATANKSQSTFTADQRFLAYAFTKSTTDIWGEALAFSNTLLSSTLFQGSGYAIIASQYSLCKLYGYICLVNNNFLELKQVAGLNTSKIFMFETR